MRRVFSVIIILLLVLSGLWVMISFDIGVQDAAAEDWTSSIDVNTIWASDKNLLNTIYISAGVTLTINAGVTVNFAGNYKLVVNSTGELITQGTKQNPVVFDRNGALWNSIEVNVGGNALFNWCTFINASTAITLISNNFRTKVTNCTFDGSCTQYFYLSNSKLNVTSSRFNGLPFDNSTTLPTNLINTLTIDTSSELYIEYFVNINTVDGYTSPLPNINGDVSDSRHTSIGITDGNGQFWYSPATACKITKPASSVKAEFLYSTFATVWDQFYGTSKEVTGISLNDTQFNASAKSKDSDLYIPLTFMFKYPPFIQTSLSSVKVNEDQNQTIKFVIYDNDDLNVDLGINQLTINITDQNGKGIYGSNTKDKWISWSNTTNSDGSHGQLHFYRTIESPFSPPKPNDYNAVVHEDIYITIIDQFNQKDSIGPIDVEFTNVPDKPEITGLPLPTAVVYVTEDIEKIIPITVSDNDNLTSKINVYSINKYVSYEYNGPTDQNLILNYKNDFGEDGKQEQVFVNATDGCSDPVSYSFLVQFTQTPDPPQIIGVIPDKYGDEETWASDLSLGTYASDDDPDDSATTLKWHVTGLDTKVYGEKLFTVSNQNATADAPLSFNLNTDVDLGGARDVPKTYSDTITLWLTDKDGNSTSQDITLYVNATNQPPSMHKIEYQGKKTTVIPESGLTSDYYTFKVEYRDLDGQFGDEPEYIKVVIDGKEYDMLEEDPADTNYIDGKIYKYVASMFSPGVHEHYFKCSDSLIETRLPLPDADPINISGPEVVAKTYVIRKESVDGNFVVRLAHQSIDPVANIIDANKPSLEWEPDKDELNKTKGDMGKYFSIDIKNINAVLWAEVTVKFGSDYSNYNVTWLRKNDMQLAYYSPTPNEWKMLSFSTMDTTFKVLKVNLTPVTGQQMVLTDMLSLTNAPIFTVAGMLDADGDNYFNPKDAFPFDPAAREDRDRDGSPGKNEWVSGKSAKDSTTGLHEDQFPDDAAASIDNDNDRCPDEWNPGKSKKDSTTGLTLDMFPGNPGACEDTDGDGQPDVLIKEKDTQNLIEDPDDDNDGIPDWWEDEWRQYGIDNSEKELFDPKNDTDAKKDFDGDGLKNIDEYKKGKNPYKKDADESVLSDPFIMILIIIIIIVIIVIIAGFILRKRGKKGEEEPGKVVEGAPPGPEADEGPVPPEARVEGPLPPEELPSPEGEQFEPEPPVGEMEEAIPPVEEGEGIIMEEGMAAQPPAEPPIPTEPVEGAPPEEVPAEAPAEQPQEGAESETSAEPGAIEFTCPNCGTALNRDMTQCPGCAAPLMFD